MQVEVGDLIADNRGIDVLGREHRHQAAGQADRRNAHGAGLGVGEISEFRCVSSGLDNEMAQIHLLDRVPLRVRQDPVSRDDKLVLPYEPAWHGQITPMLRTHEAGLRLLPFSSRTEMIVGPGHPHRLPEPRTPRLSDRQDRTTGREIGRSALAPSQSFSQWTPAMRVSTPTIWRLTVVGCEWHTQSATDLVVD